MGGPERFATQKLSSKMKLGNFCLSLTVKNLAASQAFYEKLGFRPAGGDAAIVVAGGT